MAKSAAARKRQRQRRKAKLKGINKGANHNKNAPVKRHNRKRVARHVPQRRAAGRQHGSGAVSRNSRRRGKTEGNFSLFRQMKGMKLSTDGISVSKSVHNGSHIADTYQPRREKVFNAISGGVPFTINELVINPGNTQLFPWFSTIAANYDQWRCDYLVFSYETEAYTASGTNISAGKVIMATNYDVDDPIFNDDLQMENYVNSDKSAPFTENVHDVLAGDHNLKNDPLKNYYVSYSQNVIAPTTGAGKFFDLGTFNIATQGQPTAAAGIEIGELYVTYQFTMIRPRNPPTSSALLLRAGHVDELTVGSANAANPLGTAVTGPAITVNTYMLNDLSGKVGNDLVYFGGQNGGVTNTLILPSIGRYLIAAAWTGAGSATTNPSISLGANILTENDLADGVQSSIAAFTGTTSAIVETVNVVASSAVGAVLANAVANAFTFGGNANMSAQKCDVFICQLPNLIGAIPILMETGHRVYRACRDRTQSVLNGDRLSILEEKMNKMMSTIKEDDSDADYDRPLSASSSSSSSSLSLVSTHLRRNYKV